MSKSSGFTGLFASLIALFSTPIIGLALLIAAGVLILVLLGVFIWVFITLQALHLVTAIIFTVCTLFLFYICTHSHVITEDTFKHYPWLPLLIPGSFLFGYVADVTSSLQFSVAPFATATPQQGTVNAIVLFLMIVGILYVVSEHVSSEVPRSTTRRRRR